MAPGSFEMSDAEGTTVCPRFSKNSIQRLEISCESIAFLRQFCVKFYEIYQVRHAVITATLQYRLVKEIFTQLSVTLDAGGAKFLLCSGNPRFHVEQFPLGSSPICGSNFLLTHLTVPGIYRTRTYILFLSLNFSMKFSFFFLHAFTNTRSKFDSFKRIGLKRLTNG